jgi:hypothetical protein
MPIFHHPPSSIFCQRTSSSPSVYPHTPTTTQQALDRARRMQR